MPIYALIEETEYFTPKMKEIAKRQEAAKLEAELTGKKNKMPIPGQRGRR